MYSVILLAAMAGPHDQAVKVADEVKANGRAFAFRGRGVNVRVGGFGAFRGGFGFRHGGAFRFGHGFRFGHAFRFNSFRYAAPFYGFRSSYYVPFMASYAYAPQAFASYSSHCAPAASYYAPQAFSSGCGCEGTSAAVQELRAAVAELRQALQYR